MISAFSEFLPLIAAGVTVISANGLVARLGPGRAAVIALRSRFGFKPNHESLRMAEIELLRSMIGTKQIDEGYIVITGERGVGKTCFMNTAISKTAGVIEVEALSTHNAGTIIEQALCELTNMRPGFLSPLASAKRVIFWHRVFTGGLSPIVVISATDRKSGDGYAALTPAVRTLVDRYNLRVVVDGSPSTLDESLFRTKRQRVFEVRPMTKEMVLQICQFQQLFQYVKKANFEDTVFAVLGGIPADYQALWDYCAIRLRNGRDAREVIGAFLCSFIYIAMTHVNDARAKHPATAQMVKLFQGKSMLTMSTLLENNLVRPIPDKVFREVEQNGVPVLIPDSNAMGIVLRHHLTEELSLDELEKLLKNKV